MADGQSLPGSVDETLSLLEGDRYVASRPLATAVFLSLQLGRPLLLEGEAGVGKTELARVLAAALGRELLRLQCYEGLDLAGAAYEWNYPRQLLALRAAEARGESRALDDIYTHEFLIARPLLAALQGDPAGAPVLLIDELDRADEPFEAFLLEFLSDWQMSIPELGTVTAAAPPIVVITSNRTREVHDALRRRCFYHWVDYPDAAAERAILAARAPQIDTALTDSLVRFVQALREIDLYKRPGVAETIDWAETLATIGAVELSTEVVNDTLGTLLKYQDDIEAVQGEALQRLLAAAG
ncbi:MAG: MoxR family ATPase [Pseudomonadota bacterium]